MAIRQALKIQVTSRGNYRNGPDRETRWHGISVGWRPEQAGSLSIIAGGDVGFWQRMLGRNQKIPLRDKDVAASIEVIS